MESHPIPQQISSYQFRLVGDMTLKQFFQIAGGALVSIVIYSLPIPGIIKWPFVIASALLGVALAFLPLEERPLEHWLLAFFKSIYSPTIFNWQKSTSIPSYFQEEAAPPSEKILYPGGEQKLQEYLTTSSSDQLSGKLEKIEGAFLSGISSIFNITPVPKAAEALVVTGPKPPLLTPAQTSIKVPTSAPKLVVEETSQEGVNRVSISPVTPVSIPSPLIAERGVQFSIDAAPPNPPMTPNTLTGQVIDEERKIIQGAIMEIKDSAGRAVRALKSNMLGHFLIVTPLQSGTYEIITEKDGYVFETVSFEAKGEIIPPIAISGRKVAQ